MLRRVIGCEALMGERLLFPAGVFSENITVNILKEPAIAISNVIAIPGSCMLVQAFYYYYNVKF
jgi:hypothetical protein